MDAIITSDFGWRGIWSNCSNGCGCVTASDRFPPARSLCQDGDFTPDYGHIDRPALEVSAPPRKQVSLTIGPTGETGTGRDITNYSGNC